MGGSRGLSALKVAGLLALCLIAGIVGSLMTSHFGKSQYTLSYADFISIMLTAVSLLITVLAVFLAVVGFVGWTSIEQKAHLKTEEYLQDGFREGGALDEMLNMRVTEALKAKTQEMMFEGVSPIGSEDDGAEGEGQS
ncbi:hypothetical protein [Sphingomonas kyungheensis]